MIKGSIQEKDITIINIYAPNSGAPQYVRQMLTSMKGEINNNTIIVGDFNTPLTPMDRSTKQKINKETQTLNDTIDQLDLTDIYRTFHPKTMNFTFFSSAHGTFSRIDHILGHKSSLGKFKKIQIIPSIFSDHNAVRLDLNYRRKTIKNSNIWRLNNTLLNNQQITEEIKKEIIEKVILVAVADQDTTEAEESLDELEELVKTAGAEVAARVIQVRETPHPGTYIGKGKIDEVNALLYGTNATGIVCDDELSPAQISNLEEALDTKVMDRTLIILDIFAKRAFTREGKIQVELAQLKYRASKLTGQGRALSRLGGEIGTRGPGEKKLEMDRRLIRTRISRLKAELRDVVKHREVQRKQRQKNHLPVVCIVGYTNAGKSTLLNHFTNAGVYEEDQLFATLDPTTKSLDLSGGQTILMTDTVGFIRKLPHHLVEAFKSTLEEAKYSDLILHVVDASNPQKEKQMEAVYDTLKQLGANESPIITAFNKIDLLNGDEILKDPNAEAVVRISGKNGEGTDQLLEQIEKILQKQKLYLEKLYGYQEAGKIQLIRSHGQLLKEEYRDDGIYVEAYIPKEILGSI